MLTNEPDLFATLPATKLKTFSTMEKKSKLKTSNGKIVELQNDLNFISRMLAVGKSRDIDMKEVFTHSLGQFPSPIATNDGHLVKTSKAKLMHIIESRVEDASIEQVPCNNALMIDGMALIQTTKNIPQTFGALVEVVLKRILSLASSLKSTRVDYVCDTYPEISIKDIERSNRASEGSTVIRILGPQQKVPRQFKKFLANGKNKDALVEFFFQHLPHIQGLPMLLGVVELFVTHREQCHKVANFTNDEIQIDECPELFTDHVEADTRLLLHAKHASSHHNDVIIHSPDTDVFVMMVGHKPAIHAALYFQTGVGNHRRILDVTKIYSSLGSELCDALIGFHAFTGRDNSYNINNTVYTNYIADLFFFFFNIQQGS